MSVFVSFVGFRLLKIIDLNEIKKVKAYLTDVLPILTTLGMENVIEEITRKLESMPK